MGSLLERIYLLEMGSLLETNISHAPINAIHPFPHLRLEPKREKAPCICRHRQRPYSEQDEKQDNRAYIAGFHGYFPLIIPG